MSAYLIDSSRDALGFIADLDRLTGTGEVVDATQEMLGRFGFETLVVFGLPTPEQCLDDVLIGQCGPAEWFALYARENYLHVDPVVRIARRTVNPFEWSEIAYDSEREPRAAEVMRRRRDFGFGRALVVPIPGPGGSVAGLSMTGRNVELTARTRPALHLMALYAFDRLSRLRSTVAVKRPVLTEREREVLTWVAAGKSALDIAEILHLAKRTVDEHAASAIRKLGAINRAQAVAIAVRDGLVSL